MSQKRKGDTAVITDKERKNREELAAYRRRELFRLMRENPELPVVPMVDWEITGDDNGVPTRMRILLCPEDREKVWRLRPQWPYYDAQSIAEGGTF